MGRRRPYLLVDIPPLDAVAILVVKQGRLGHVDDVGEHGNDEPNQSTEDPSLCAVEQVVDAAPKVLAAAQGLDPVGIGDAVMHPVGRGELIVPDAFVGEDGAFGFGAKGQVLAVGERLDQTLAPRVCAAMVTGRTLDAACVSRREEGKKRREEMASVSFVLPLSRIIIIIISSREGHMTNLRNWRSSTGPAVWASRSRPGCGRATGSSGAENARPSRRSRTGAGS